MRLRLLVSCHRCEVACEVEVRLQSAGKQQPGSRPRIPPSPSSLAHCCAIFLSYLGGEIFHLVGQLTTSSTSSPSFPFEKYRTKKKSSQTHPSLYIYPQAAPPPLVLPLKSTRQKVKVQKHIPPSTSTLKQPLLLYF